MIVIIDSGISNVNAVKNMLSRLYIESKIVSNQEEIERADKIIFPGVGSFDEGMRSLQDLGLIKVLEKKVLKDKIPFLGICLGMQLLTKKSEEGNINGLGWVDCETIKFNFKNLESKENLRIPHMGWNTIKILKDDPLFKGLPKNNRFYFVHSYHLKCNNRRDILAISNYGYDFPAVIRKSNIYGVQFHPEKSHKFGMVILENFARRV